MDVAKFEERREENVADLSARIVAEGFPEQAPALSVLMIDAMRVAFEAAGHGARTVTPNDVQALIRVTSHAVIGHFRKAHADGVIVGSGWTTEHAVRYGEQLAAGFVLNALDYIPNAQGEGIFINCVLRLAHGMAGRGFDLPVVRMFPGEAS